MNKSRISSVINNSEKRRTVSKEYLIDFIKKGSKEANIRLNKIKKRYGENAEFMSYQYKKVQDNAYQANKINQSQGKKGFTSNAVLASGKYSSKTRGLSYDQLSYKAKQIAYFLKGDTSTLTGIEKNYKSRLKSISSSDAFSGKNRRFLKTLSPRELKELWEIIEHGRGDYESDTVVDVALILKENNIPVEKLKDAIDKMKNAKYTNDIIIQEIEDNITAIKNGTYEINTASEEQQQQNREDAESVIMSIYGKSIYE
jgi:hypothetical protein